MTVTQCLRIKDVAFQNRVVMAPMVCFGWENPSGRMGDRLIAHYLKRAETGIGLMVLQSLAVRSQGMGKEGVGAFRQEQMEPIARIAQACHKAGTRLFAQLSLPGFDVRQDAEAVQRLSAQELEDIVQAFIHAASLCKQAGCDGVELHGAHGYFLNMMAAPDTNRRQDAYGGGAGGRLTLARRIVEGIGPFAGRDFLISYRMGWNDTLESDLQSARLLQAAGVDMLHVSHGIPSERPLDISQGYGYSPMVYTGTQVKSAVTLPVIAVGDLRTLRRGEALLETSQCDFIAYGKPFLADARFWPHALKNRDYAPCLRCRSCQYFIDGDRCPAHGR